MTENWLYSQFSVMEGCIVNIDNTNKYVEKIFDIEINDLLEGNLEIIKYILSRKRRYNKNNMDILAHTLWANAGARGLNGLRAKKGKPKIIHPGWTGFWGVFPDFFAFTIPFIAMIWRVITGQASLGHWHNHDAVFGGFDLAAYLYQWSHSLAIWASVFIIVWIIYKRPRFELLGWALHILIDIPSHVIDFYPTPFLFPISEYRFPYGIQWSNMWYMIINYTALAGVWGLILFAKFRKSKTLKT